MLEYIIAKNHVAPNHLWRLQVQEIFYNAWAPGKYISRGACRTKRSSSLLAEGLHNLGIAAAIRPSRQVFQVRDALLAVSCVISLAAYRGHWSICSAAAKPIEESEQSAAAKKAAQKKGKPAALKCCSKCYTDNTSPQI